MRCPFCGSEDNKVVDSRPSKEGHSVRRRRECTICSKRFTTYEYVEKVPLMIVKKDDRREPFSREKLLEGIELACKKRPISREQIEKIVDDIETDVYTLSKVEVPSKEIGEKVIRALKNLDEVSYVRFASVYRQFKDKEEFLKELKKMFDDGGKK
ncbi:transcriptional repressor NrdR [candidate division WOR-3 bacterium]|nr:transcriptional repressor NrdR [candidate division WOR-3 bacterium]